MISKKISLATGAKVVASVDELNHSSLGSAGKVYEKKLGEDEHIFIEKCASPLSVTILLRGGSKYVTDEAERAVTDALSVVRNVVEDGRIVAGGGAIEIHINQVLENLAKTEESKERLAIKAFADAILSIPKTLAENSGLDPIDKISSLIASYANGNHNFGLDLKNGEVKDMIEEGVVEPIRVKENALKAASEAAKMILRIDDVIATKGGGEQAMPPGMGGMPPGMGGMPPM